MRPVVASEGDSDGAAPEAAPPLTARAMAGACFDAVSDTDDGAPRRTTTASWVAAPSGSGWAQRSAALRVRRTCGTAEWITTILILAARARTSMASAQSSRVSDDSATSHTPTTHTHRHPVTHATPFWV